jgi:hypothetical protein
MNWHLRVVEPCDQMPLRTLPLSSMTMARIRNAGRPHPILTATNMGTIMFPKMPESKGVNLSL